MKISQEKRALLATLVLICVVPFVGGIIFVVGYEFLILAFGGVNDLIYSLKNISWTPGYSREISFRILLFIIAGASLGFACYLWYRIFYLSGYVRTNAVLHDSRRLSNEGQKWPPFALVCFALVNGWVGFEALKSGSLPGILICGFAVLWSLFSLMRRKK